MHGFWSPNEPTVRPTQVEALAFQLDAQAYDTLTFDGNGRVSHWQSSAPVVSFSQADSTRRPLYSATGFYGLPCLQWDNTDYFTASLASLRAASGLTCFLVAQPSYGGQADTQGLATILRLGNSWSAGAVTSNFSGESFALAAAGQSSTQPRLGAAESAFDWAAAEALVCAFRVGPSGSLLYKNHQAAPFSLTAGGMTLQGNFAPAQMVIANNTVDVLLAFSGNIAEMLVYTRELTVGEMQGVTRYLRRRWRIGR